MCCKGKGRKLPWPVLRYYPIIFLERTRKPTINLRQDSRDSRIAEFGTIRIRSRVLTNQRKCWVLVTMILANNGKDYVCNDDNDCGDIDDNDSDCFSYLHNEVIVAVILMNTNVVLCTLYGGKALEKFSSDHTHISNFVLQYLSV